MPLPSYTTHQLRDKNRYRTVYAKYEGSAVAPTVGFHLTKELLKRIEDTGVKIAYAMLHINLGTFCPIKVEDVLDHHMHLGLYVVEESETGEVSDTEAADSRVICMGTTSCRTVESASTQEGVPEAKTEWAEVLAYPGYRFKVLDTLITSFHLPELTLTVLVNALTRGEHIPNTCQEAVKERYQFFSFGDAMFIASDPKAGNQQLQKV